jgi:hypothetical protein
MKSLMSLLFTLLVLAALAAGGWLLYEKAQPATTSSNTVGSTGSGRPKLTAHNDTHYVLTISMSGPQTMRLQIAPGKSQTKTVLAGTYDVEGSLSDPTTTPFKASWELKEGGTYDVPFERTEGGSGQTGGLIAARP